MLRIRLALVSLAIVLAVGAVSTASASAEFVGVQCQPRTDGHGHWKDPKCTEPGVNLTYETQEVTNSTGEGEGTTAIIKTELGSAKIYIDCQKITFTGKAEKGNAASATLKFEECKLYEEATGKLVSTCAVENITATSLSKLIGSKGAIETELTPKTGKEFTKIRIEGSICSLKGTYEVKGSQKCEVPGAEVPGFSGELNCKEAGSNLKLSTKTATVRGRIRNNLTSKDWFWTRIQ